ncbi:PAC2 family protein [Egibacter rhizosphaerae]|uniref:PAC2 family protein n=1 Tax=Egibacter rhizosphaerae TaxID=1670831 RepID=A0A411YDT6_9ACTN|nr:PAC2 family protein [Egibacter rhizosphaerae]QBI19404.1 PAC2 family protein [Egibacter rhizosphaerae]
MSKLLRWLDDLPALRDPVLLVALDGFVDAGDVGEHASTFLRHRWQAEAVAELDGDELIDFRARRPTVVVDSGQVRRVEWPRIRLHAAQLDGPRDVLLLTGPEPDMRWHAFVDAVASLCAQVDVSRVVTLSAYPAAAPHTRPIEIVQASNAVDDGPVEGARPVSGYTGPIGAATALQADLAEQNIGVLGFWAEVPHYISASPNPPGALAMVRIVADLLGTEVDTEELEAAAKLHREQVDEAVSQHDEAAELVENLEELQDSDDADTDIPSGEDIADEIERFLRSQE